jgi:hypothetical protein
MTVSVGTGGGQSMLECLSISEAERRLPRTAQNQGHSRDHQSVSFKALILHQRNVEAVEKRWEEVLPVL